MPSPFRVVVVDHTHTPVIAASRDCLAFNPSFIPASPSFNTSGVLLRQCCGPSCTGHGASAAGSTTAIAAERIGFAPCDLESGRCGAPLADFNLDPTADTEDPRALLYEGWYYNFYYSGSGPGSDPRCAGPLCTVRLAKSRTPLVAASWRQLRTLPWHRNGCCVMKPRGQRSYCIWGEGPDPSPGLGIAYTTDIDGGEWRDAEWSVAPGVRSPLTADRRPTPALAPPAPLHHLPPRASPRSPSKMTAGPTLQS